MIPRILQKKLISLAKSFPVISLTGPRQSGKTTLIRNTFQDKPYISFENMDLRLLAESDPRGFLKQYEKDGAIFDEIQKVPELFSYLQEIVDRNNKSGQFMLTGSQNFLLFEKITQSLAGRVALLTLLPFSMEEIKAETLESCLFKGFYPRLYDKNIHAADFYPQYIQTYIERDVRQIKNITDLNTFQRFVKLCANRTAQILNLSSLALDCGITHNTAKAWLSVLESSYIVFLLYPHHKNFNKRLVKMPKLYFYDTGLVCSLVDIKTEKHLNEHYSRGGLFENLVISEFMKYRFNRGDRPNFYYWRDKTGHEIDCIIEDGGELTPVEIKTGKTINSDYFKNLDYWSKLTRNDGKNSFVVYGGITNQKHKGVNVTSWRNLHSIL